MKSALYNGCKFTIAKINMCQISTHFKMLVKNTKYHKYYFKTILISGDLAAHHGGHVKQQRPGF